jgi:hypothetical protein
VRSPSRGRRPMLLKHSDRIVHLRVREQDSGLGLDVEDEFSPLQDVGWHICLEFGVANENHHGMETSTLEVEEGLNCLQVLVVLM